MAQPVGPVGIIAAYRPL